MSRSGSSDLAKGGNFTEQLLYVQHVDKEKDKASTISEQSLHEYFLNNSKIFSDSNFAEYLRNPKANVDILKSSLQDEKVIGTMVCTNPLPATLKTAVTIHAFVVFATLNLNTNDRMFYSMEKNGQYIVLQQSPNMKDVMDKLYDPEKKKLVKRLGPVERGNPVRGNGKELEYLIRAIWKTNQLSTKYHLLFSNCQNFAEFVFEEASFGGMKWSTWISRRFGLRNKKSQTEIEADTLKYNRRKDAKFVYYKAMAEGRRQDFEELAKNNLTSESLNSVDSQGYTLLEWATVFSTSKWPIDQFLIEKGAEIQTDEGLFRRNVFFIALQHLPSKKESRYLSFDGINIHGVNSTDDTALHLALYGEKWDVAEKILDQFPDDDVNVTNSEGCTPLHLAVHPKCKMVLIKKILARMNSESVNAQDEGGWTALHDAIRNQSEIAVRVLLNHKDVDVNLKDNRNQTALHYAAVAWKNMPIDLFTKIFEKSTDVNAQNGDGNTALHLAIMYKSETALQELLKRKDIDVKLKDNRNQTALHFAAGWKDIPINLFTKILEKTANVNVQDEDGWTALHWAIAMENRTAVEELLKRKDVDLNLKNKKDQTALHFATWLPNVPIDLFRIILEKSANIINALDEDGDTALHWAIRKGNRTAVEELLKRDNVDVNLRNNNNYIALHNACLWKNMPIELFTKILEKSTDINAQDEDGDTALHWAIMEENRTAVEELLKRMDVNVNLKNNKNKIALHYACWFKNMPVELLKLILEKTADVNTQAGNGCTALHLAIIFKNRTVVGELLKCKDVDFNIKNCVSKTALHFASWWKNMPIDLFRVILEKSANINEQDKDGYTALIYATFKQSTTAVEELLKHKDVDVNLKNNYNQTALHCAAVAWKNIPIKLFTKILEKTDDGIAEDVLRLHSAILCKSKKIAIRKRRQRKDLDVNQINNKIYFFFLPLFVLFSLLIIHFFLVYSG